MEKSKTRRNPATARFAREKMEKELTIRFLVRKLEYYHKRVQQMILRKGDSDRYLMLQHLLSDMSSLLEQLDGLDEPKRNMTFYARRKQYGR